jgi:NADP-dependent 3-hydroxy acid dehydrogenase YdfG
MNETIAGKVVVITGASSGSGEATARYLAERGAAVALGARRVEGLRQEVEPWNIRTTPPRGQPDRGRAGLGRRGAPAHR